MVQTHAGYVSLVFAFLTCFASSVWGCRYDAEKIGMLTLSERLDNTPIAFIGTVINVTEDKVVQFSVEHQINGELNSKQFAIKAGDSSCDIRFSVGQRWIYAGTTLLDPSILLNDNLQDISLKLQRFDDKKLNLPKIWQQCISDDDCKNLNYGCTVTAVNQRFLNEAKNHVLQQGLDPKTLNCVNDNETFKLAFCQQSLCGVWSLQNEYLRNR